MLGWVRVSHFWFFFLVVDLLLIVPTCLRFQDLVFGDVTSKLSFIAWRRLHGFLVSFFLPFPFCSFISLQLSSLFASLVALPFVIFTPPGLDSVFLLLEGCFWSQLRLWFLGGWVLLSHPQLFLFFHCFPWYRYAE